MYSGNTGTLPYSGDSKNNGGPMGLMEGKKGIIFGVANERSIAWACAKELIQGGGEVAFTYQNEIFEKRVRPLAESVKAKIVEPCDVNKDEQVEAVFKKVGDEFHGLDFMIHSIAFADKNDLSGRYIDTSREGFLKAMEVSVYSLTLLCRYAEPLMKGRNGSIVTLTYYGSEKVIYNYNVMGVAKAGLEASVRYLASDMGQGGTRVNAISAGPIRTLAASGISGLRTILELCSEKSPLKRSIAAEEVGKTALYLCSNLSSGVTGEIIYVDAGYNIMGV